MISHITHRRMKTNYFHYHTPFLSASHQLLRAGTSHYEMWDNEDSSVDHNDELSEFEQYGTTPPRTRILRRNRERKQRDLKEYSWYLIFQNLYTLVKY